jgi:iron complex outermembrane receptor protein
MTGISSRALRGQLLAASAIAVSFAVPAHAQTQAASDQQAASSGGVEEIVVTAQRREEKLHDVPIAVSAFNATMLETRNITSVTGLAGFAPNVTIVPSPGYSTEADIAIRGGVTINPAIYWEPTVGMYVDGVYIPKASGDVFDVADVDHIEILRGPQGTLYGRNTLAGAVNIVTKKPTGIFGGTLEAGASNYGGKEIRGIVNLPALGKLSISAAGKMESSDGWIDVVPNDKPSLFPTAAPTIGHLNSINRRSAHIAARLDATDDLTFDYSFDISQTKNTPNLGQLTYLAPPSSPFYSPFVYSTLSPYLLHSPRATTAIVGGSYFGNARIFENAGIRSHSLTATWDVSDELILKSITAYRWLDHSNGLNHGASPTFIVAPGVEVPFAGTQIFEHYESFSQELQASGQIDRFHYTAGLYMFTDSGHVNNPQTFFLGSANFLPQYGTKTQAYAAYAQVEYNPPILDDAMTIILGLRYSNENKYGSHLELADFGQGYFPLIPSISAQKSFDDATPNITVKYNINPDINVYARFAEGFKSGGFNDEAPTALESITPFDAETIDSYEIGAKTRWLDGRLSVNVAGFYDQHKNLQLSVFTAQNAAASVVRNAGSADISGVELEIQAVPVDDVQFSGSVGYLNTQYNTFIDGGVNVANDRAFPYAPQFTASASVDWKVLETTNFGALHLVGDYIHSDAYYEYPYSLSTDPAINKGSYAGTTKAGQENVVNLRARLVGIEIPSGTLDIEAYGKNIFDDKYRINGIDFGGGFGNLTESYYNPPPMYGGTLIYHFGGASAPEAAPEAPYTPPPVQAPAVARSYMVFFDFDKSDLTPDAVRIVDQAAANAAPAKATTLVVTGHTDTVGSDAYNLRLGKRRAESVAAQLEKDGIPSSEIQIISKGKRDLLVPTKDGVREPQNRRVTIVYEGGPTS